VERFEVPDPRALPERLAAGRTEPPTVQDISPQIDFLYRAVDNFDRAVQFADAKAGGVLLILGIGVLDLFRNLRHFLDARDLAAAWGWLATVSCILATVFAIATVVQVGRSLFPRGRPGLGSLFFFGVAGSFPSPKEYGDAVWQAPERELFRSMATSAWNLATIAGEKYRHLRFAYATALLFAVWWAIARLGLSLAH
jgi:pycsar effector protein